MKRLPLHPRPRACGLFVAAAIAAPCSGAPPSTISHCFSSVRVYPETGDTGGYRLHIVLCGTVASGTLEFYEGSATPVPVQVRGSFKRGYLQLSSVPEAPSVPFTLSGAPTSRAFTGTLAFERGALVETEPVSIPRAPPEQCATAPAQ